jgi:hypothetical protein
MKVVIYVVSILSVLSIAGPVRAAEARPDEKQLSVHPAPLPQPSLRYCFMPDAADQTPGNAALAYLMASAQTPIDQRMNELLDTPMNDLRKAGAEDFLGKQDFALRRVRSATRCTECQWDPSFRQSGLAWIGDYLNRTRWMADVLTIKIRLAIADGRYDEAVDSLRDGFMLARNLAREGPLVQALVAVGIESVMLHDANELVQAKNAPNLYWGLANLPRSMVDLRAVMEMDTAAVFFTFPELKDHPEQLSAVRSRDLLSRLAMYSHGSPTAEDSAAALVHMMKVYPAAKERLTRAGLKPQEVENLAANSVVLAYDVAQYRQQGQEFIKWAGLPPWDSLPGLRAAGDRIQAERQDYNALTLLLPNFHNAGLQIARVDRELAMMMCVEAIRAYAASHDSKPPPNLEALSPQTPAPVDPMSGKAFEYQAKENVLTLRGPAPEGERKGFEAVFRITLER